jgi:hypothetical protein
VGKGDSAGKRRVEAQREDRRLAKANRRADLSSADASPVDESALMERFRQVSEQHQQGLLSDDAYDLERREIFAALGLESPS